MICPRWLSTPTQPIAVDDVVEYLLAARELPLGDSQIVEIGGADVVTYGDIIREYARQRGLRRLMISVPVLTPYLSGLWLALVTPTEFQTAGISSKASRIPRSYETTARNPNSNPTRSACARRSSAH